MNNKNFEINSRVKKSGRESIKGTILEIKKELVSNSIKTHAEAYLMIVVQWDNGTRSYYSESSLENA